MTNQNKDKLYEEAKKEIKVRLKNIEFGNIIPRMATVTAVLKSKFLNMLWCGFYFAEEDEMIVGPYQGPSACPNIKYSGVCGLSAKKKETVIVPNVHEFPGHIVCDEKSNSEIVVPLLDEEKRIIAVLDIDSANFSEFDKTDKKHLEEIMTFLL